MRIPPGMTESQVTEVITKVIRRLSRQFTFGYFERSDIEQHAWLCALQGLVDYDGVRPLENFLHVHIRNRLINLRRDKFRRSDPPCRYCHEHGHHHDQEGVCEAYTRWWERNRTKTNLVMPLDLWSMSEEHSAESKVEEEAQLSELQARIDAALPADLRRAYLRLLAGQRVSRELRDRIEQVVRGVLGEEKEPTDE